MLANGVIGKGGDVGGVTNTGRESLSSTTMGLIGESPLSMSMGSSGVFPWRVKENGSPETKRTFLFCPFPLPQLATCVPRIDFSDLISRLVWDQGGGVLEMDL